MNLKILEQQGLENEAGGSVMNGSKVQSPADIAFAGLLLCRLLL